MVGGLTSGRRLLVCAGAVSALSFPSTPTQAAGPSSAPGPPARRVSMSPQPGTVDASPRTQISLRGVPAGELGAITVVGSVTGAHPGKLEPYSSAPGASFLPSRPFAAGEQVHVTMTGKPAGAAGLDYRFTVGRPGPIGLRKATPGEVPPAPKVPPNPQTFVSRLDLRPPTLDVTTRTSRASPGDIFVGPIAAPARAGPPPAFQHGPAIFDSRGQLVWFSPVLGPEGVLNFHRQTLNGAPVLTWWQGRALFPFPGIGFGQDIILDSSYRELGRVRAGNGYQADLHDFTISGDSAWVPAYSPVLVDLPAELSSYIGGQRQVTVLDAIVQQVDLKTGLVMFEWHSLGHVPLVDTFIEPQRRVVYDAFHLNSVQPLGGDTLLLSLRSMDAVYLVSTTSGRVLWTLGGSRSSFRLGRGAAFAWQHDAQYRADGTISMFDDEAAPPVHPPSRGLVLSLDLARRRAAVVHRYLHRPAVLTGSQGNMQALPNGAELVGWGAEPYISEYGASGRATFEAQFQPGVESYRAFRAPWRGRPRDSPAVAALPAISGRERVVYASWNGATEVASWRVLAGSSPTHMSVVAVRARNGFETAITVPSSGPYFAATALDGAGRPLGTSRPIKA